MKKARVVNIIVVVVTWLGMTACQSTSKPTPGLAYQLQLPTNWPDATQPSEPIPAAQLFQLSQQQQQDFVHYFNAPVNQSRAPNWRLYDYLEGRLAGFDYKGDTYTAQQALEKNAGNCLSLALVTGALAKLVGLELDYQQVDSAPVYRMQNNLLMLSSHVRTKVYDPSFKPEKDILYLSRPGVVIDYLPARGDRYGAKRTEQDVIAMFYQNQAAEALVNNQLTLAYQLSRRALQHGQLNPGSLNSLAVAYSRAGLIDESAQTYAYARERGATSLELLDNYRKLLLRQGKRAEAAEIAVQLGNVDDANPYNWLSLAEGFFAEGKVHYALENYLKAQQLAPYLEESYLGLAKSYHAMGKLVKASEALEKAIALSYQTRQRQLYEAKLSTLRASAHSGEEVSR